MPITGPDMFRRIIAPLLCWLAVLAAAPALSRDVLATVNRVEITEGHFEMFLRGLPRDYIRAELRPALLAHLIDQQVLAERMAPRFDPDGYYIRLRQAKVAEAYLGARFDAISVSEDDLVDMYLKTYGRLAWFDLTVATLPKRDAAQAFAQRVALGKSFAEAAREAGAEASLFEADWLRRKELDPAILRAAAVLHSGGVSDPVRSRSGWHVVRADMIWHAPPFFGVRDELTKLARFEQVLEALRTQSDAPQDLIYLLENETRRFLAEAALAGGVGHGPFVWRSSKRYLEEHGDRVEYLVRLSAFPTRDAALDAVDYVRNRHRATEGFEPQPDWRPVDDQTAWVRPSTLPASLMPPVLGTSFGLWQGPYEVTGRYYLIMVNDVRGGPSYTYDERRLYSEDPQMRSPDMSDIWPDLRENVDVIPRSELARVADSAKRLPFRTLLEAYNLPGD
ncbi:hypothetical protein Dshi_0267 [Dinoroseobacter shibae DFL 12 = DSM 16493]|uniref:Parvulin-like PPIase n=2 Tax=Dinoroseobacter shibae TaxID=215813 RepID=A8LLK6_DINSH|nr:hypothetical protein Dshi_0267 [Dinoroseobacter shibae DFL 12 = DSM 16493]